MRRVFGRIPEDSGVLEAAVAGVSGRLRAGGVAVIAAANTGACSTAGDCTVGGDSASLAPVESSFPGTDLAEMSTRGEASSLTTEEWSTAHFSTPSMTTSSSPASTWVGAVVVRAVLGQPSPDTLLPCLGEAVTAESTVLESPDFTLMASSFAALTSTL